MFFDQGQKSVIECALTILSEKILNINESKGFTDHWNDGEKIALMHSELSEGLEALRNDLMSNHIPKFKGIEEEMADVIIRVLHFCEVKKLKIADALIAKIEFNETRIFKHGKRF